MRTSPATPTWGSHLRSWRPVLLALALLAAVAVVISLMSGPATSKTPYATNNPHTNGTMALAELLRAEGVAVDSPSSWSDVVEKAGPGTTIALVNAGELTEEERRTLASQGADVTVVGTLYQDLSGLFAGSADEPTPTGVSAPAGTPLQAQCEDPDATAAGSIDGSRGSVLVPDGAGAVGCFPTSTSGGHYAYTVVEGEDGTTVRLIADADLLTNGRLTAEGHAALAIRALGHHERVLWVDGAALATVATTDVSLPPWVPPFRLQAVILVLVLAVVQGRRTGRLVEEDLPVVVRATETTRGRGRLYRHAADLPRAAGALRAGTARRLGRRLGLPTSADGESLVDAVADATGLPAPTVQELLRGPVPDNDRALADLAVQLDRLESEVTSR